MVIEKEIFNSLQEARNAKKRGASRHSSGWIPIQTNKLSNGKYEIVFSNRPDTPKPKRQLTQRQLLDELANERGAEIV